MASEEKDKGIVLASNLQAFIGKTTFEKILRKYSCSYDELETLLKKIYKLWHKFGTNYSLAKEIGISPMKVTLLTNFVKEKKIIKDFKTPRRNLTEEQKEKILETKKLYDELFNLSSVAKRLGITRERVRQILEKGNDYGIIEYKPSYLKRFDEIAKKFSKKELEELFVEFGSTSSLVPYLKNKLDIKVTKEYLKNLFKIYNIDCDYLSLQHKKKRCFLEYNEMIQELGYHPTTTIMAERLKWRALWYRISRLWGCMDNFRKEFGIPIPSKGNPRFRELMAEARKKRVGRKIEKLEKIVEYINNNSPTNFREISQNLDIKESPLYEYLKELRERNLIDWMNHKGRLLYFRKS